MLRFDGEVFLLGTAIAAPLNAWSTTIKIATICASSRRGSFWGFPAGGGRIVANRGSYSETREERKVRGLARFPQDLFRSGRNGTSSTSSTS